MHILDDKALPQHVLADETFPVHSLGDAENLLPQRGVVRRPDVEVVADFRSVFIPITIETQTWSQLHLVWKLELENHAILEPNGRVP